MTGIRELFASFSEPDDFDSQYQLELFSWRTKEWQRQHDAWRNRLRRAEIRAYKCAHWKRLAADEARAAARREYNRQWMANKRAEQRAA